MTKSEQIKIRNNKIRANNAQYNIDRKNAEISAYSSSDLDKYELLTNQDLGYKPDAQARFEYSPLGKVFTDGLHEKTRNIDKKMGIFRRLKNIEDNLSSDNDDNGDNRKKISLFTIKKDIKDKGIKISYDDEAIEEIRKNLRFLRDRGVTDFEIADMRDEIRSYM